MNVWRGTITIDGNPCEVIVYYTHPTADKLGEWRGNGTGKINLEHIDLTKQTEIGDLIINKWRLDGFTFLGTGPIKL